MRIIYCYFDIFYSKRRQRRRIQAYAADDDVQKQREKVINEFVGINNERMGQGDAIFQEVGLIVWK